jgi:hypothetical protein
LIQHLPYNITPNYRTNFFVLLFQSMQVIPVLTPSDERRFLKVPVTLYASDPHWVRPLNKDILDVFNPAKNKTFRFGEVARWILVDSTGSDVGRIAAFTNSKYKNKGDEISVGGIGFFECVQDQQAANLLFDTARHWLTERGMQAMDGPINFGERDRWWGLVTEGFHPPLYGMNYNFPYYQELFENYGFRVFFNQICYGFDPIAPLAERVTERHRQFSADKNFSCRYFNKKQLPFFAQAFTTVYNKAWAGHGGLKQVTVEQVTIMFRKMKPVIDEKIMYFAFHKEEPVGIFLNLPDLNQYFRYFNGRFGWLEKLWFLWLQTFQPARKFTGLVFGVVPEWQGKGIDAYMIGECKRTMLNSRKFYSEYEMQWIGDFNPKMLNVVEHFGDTFKSRNLVTYRHLFNPDRPFERHPILI